MYLADLEKNIIHDMSFIRHECQTREIKPEMKKKIYSINTVKRMVQTDHVPPFNGCQYCMSEYHNFDFTLLFR